MQQVQIPKLARSTVGKNGSESIDVFADTENNNQLTTRLADGSFVVISEISRQPKVLRALISQAGVAAPTMVVLQNTLGVVPTLSYDGVGLYSINSVGAFPVAKTMVSINPCVETGSFNDGVAGIRKGSDDVIVISTNVTPAGALGDGLLVSTPIEIIVYP